MLAGPQGIKNRVLRVIDFCEGEGIEIFSFTDLETEGDYSVDFSLELMDDNYWHLIVSFDYYNFVREVTDIYFYKIEDKNFVQVENFDFDEDEDYFDEDEREY